MIGKVGNAFFNFCFVNLFLLCVCLCSAAAVFYCPRVVTSGSLFGVVCCRRSEKSKRRTRALASTLEPRWNQTFLYSHLRRSELRSRFLEITVWDSDRLDTGRLIGEVLGLFFSLFSLFFFLSTFYSLLFSRTLRAIPICLQSDIVGMGKKMGWKMEIPSIAITQNHR